MYTLYGISNCDTVKKARRWLEAHHIDYEFRDMRKPAIESKEIKTLLQLADWQELLNKKSRTWRDLPDSDKDRLNKTSAIRLMQEQPTLIKRPVLVGDKTVLIGFDESAYKNLG